MPRPDAHPVAAELERRRPRQTDVPESTPAPAAEKPRRPWWRRLLSVTLWVVVVVGALAYATSLAVPLWYQAHDQRLLIVTSGSMRPYFAAGDAVVMRNVTNPSQLKPGQVVSFWPQNSRRLVTHRVVELITIGSSKTNPKTGRAEPVLRPDGSQATAPYIITKGDANDVRDPDATPITRVRGIVLSVKPGWGWVLQWTQSPAGRAVMLVPPLLALGTLELMSLSDARRRRATSRPSREERHVDAVLHG
ncbi:signal peptidase I [Cellulomonas sp. HZM]|uniref:signal peptidase I n=1 Tax=Cellulomonas sp. HZM TaxID=1454010 RepID=UPI000550006C|nr:signal peptidase I [Cellulomonas sp. HZM]